MLQNVEYCPILHARVAEIKALANLPVPTKDQLFPIIVGRPWPNAKALCRTWEKIEEAIGERRFALDLDRTRQNVGDSTAARDFNALFAPQNGFQNYYDELSSIGHAVPVLRIVGGAAPELDAQIANVDALDRGVVLRLEYGAVQNPVSLAEDVLQRVDDVAIVIDLGWSMELLSRQAWASSIIEAITNIQPEAELVVAGSSFPDQFQGVGARGELPVRERELHSRLVRQHNAAHIVYGDWGSTRPPSVDTGPMRNVPRIDLPRVGTWICFRRDGVEDYPEIARRLMADVSWPAGLQIWGTYTIECTASGIPGAIRSPGTAAAARINIHMHHQVHSAAPDQANDGDEPFTD